MTTPAEALGPPVTASTLPSPPADYGDPAAEFRAVAQGAAVHDSSNLGRISAVGADVLDLLNRLSTNRVDNLQPGQGAPTILTTDKGRVIDLAHVFNLGPTALLLTGPGAQTPVMEWVDRYTFIEDSELDDVTASTSLLTLAGRDAGLIFRRVFGASIDEQVNYGCVSARVDHIDVTVMRMDLGIHPAVHMMTAAAEAPEMWDRLAHAGATAVGSVAWEALRISLGVPLYGRELDERFNPLEAGLINVIDFDKGCYIGQEVIARLDTYQKVQRALVSFTVREGEGVEAGHELTHDGRTVGTVTSVAKLPGGEDTVGLGYARRDAAEAGRRLVVKQAPGVVVEVTGLPRLLGP